MNFNFTTENLLESLEYMGIGMLGVFLVAGVIILSIFILNKVTAPRKSKEDKADK